MSTTSEKVEPLNGNAIVAANIRAEMGYAELTQEELAKLLGQSKMWMSRRYNERVEYNASEILRLADIFGVEPGELFTHRKRNPRFGGGSRRRALYLVGEEAEAANFTVESRHLAEIIPINQRALARA